MAGPPFWTDDPGPVEYKHWEIYIASLFQDSRGGGYWINPGVGRKDFWFLGWQVQREIDKTLSLGVEIFCEIPLETGSEHNLAFNAGAIINITENHPILMSAGTDISGPVDFLSCIACQFTFGPEKEKGEVAKH
jgi:hypothetical protein